MPDDF